MELGGGAARVLVPVSGNKTADDKGQGIHATSSVALKLKQETVTQGDQWAIMKDSSQSSASASPSGSNETPVIVCHIID